MIWFTSDLHFGHDREFIWGARGYTSVDEMNDLQIEKWNLLINEDDDVYVLGDLSLGSHNNILEFIPKLKGKIHIVLGNHDTPTREEIYKNLDNVVEVAPAIRLKYKKYNFFLTHYPCLTGNLEREALSQMTLNLYGHTHQKTNFYEDRPYMYHVGVDSHDGYPVNIETIISAMKNKVKECEEYLEINDIVIVLEEKLDQLLKKLPKPTIRCSKCVYENTGCGHTDFDGNCKKYKRDAPDGGYYG